MTYELCRHIKTNGRRCESPALRNENSCYFHYRSRFRHQANRSGRSRTKPEKPNTLLIPFLEDREAIQVALSLVIEAVTIGTVDDKRASVLLRGLAIASRNAAEINIKPYAPDVVRSYTPTLDGLSLAERRMNDNSTPPPRPRPRHEFDKSAFNDLDTDEPDPARPDQNDQRPDAEHETQPPPAPQDAVL